MNSEGHHVADAHSDISHGGHLDTANHYHHHHNHNGEHEHHHHGHHHHQDENNHHHYLNGAPNTFERQPLLEQRSVRIYGPVYPNYRPEIHRRNQESRSCSDQLGWWAFAFTALCLVTFIAWSLNFL